MCGICGLRKFGEESIQQRQIEMLLMMNERRGNQATGVALQNLNDPKVYVCKIDEPAGRFVASKQFKDFMGEHLNKDTQIVIGHTRLATQGSPSKNENNHPVFAGETAVVHNGCISNDYTLFNNMTELKRKAAVDTDIIRALLDKGGLTKEGGKLLNRLSGSAAIAAISSKYPGKLLLARSGSPIQMASTEGELMIWASEKVAIHNTMREYVRKFNGIFLRRQRPDLCLATMRDNSVWLFDEKGLIWNDGFTGTSSYFTPNYKVHSTYRNLRDRGGYEDTVEAV